VQWWTGWTVARTNAALEGAGAVEVELVDGAGGGTTAGYALPHDLDTTREPASWVAFLPALDTTTMAWADRGFYLGDHAPVLFDRNGNAGPTIWLDGRIVGGWAQRASGQVVTRLLEDVGRGAKRAIEAEAGRVAEWLGPDRIVPRFRTPTERELVA
jgi:hypothetical protein